MEVTEIRITRNFEIAGKVVFKSTLLFASALYRDANFTEGMSDLYNFAGEGIGTIRGHWFDFAGGDLFEKVSRDEA